MKTETITDNETLLNKRRFPPGKIAIAISGAVLAIFMAIAAWLTLGNNRAIPVLSRTSPTTKTASITIPTLKPLQPNASILVFQANTGSSLVTTSLVGLDGVTKSAFMSDPTSATYDSSFFSQERTLLIEGDALLASNNAHSSFSLLSPNSSKTPVSSSLTSLLLAPGRNDPITLAYGITSGDNLFALDFGSDGSNKVDYVKINLATGATTKLLSAASTFVPQNGNSVTDELLPSTISLDGKMMYLLAKDAKIDSVDLIGESLVSLNLLTGKFTTKPLPQGDYSGAAVSKDGNLVVYQTYVMNNNYAVFSNHIYNVGAGKDVLIPSEGLGLVHNDPTNVSFSPDGLYLVELGGHIANSGKTGIALQIFSTKNMTLAHQSEFESFQKGASNKVSGIGWAGDHVMVYVTDSSQKVAHSIDAVTGKVFDFSTELGELETVLNYRR